MIKAPVPDDDASRVASLASTGMVGTPAEYALDCITRIAVGLFDVPAACISLIDADRQHFKSCIGLDVQETPRDISFCGHAVAENKPVVVEDALRDLRFADNPLVVSAPNIRFYAGQPIHAADGAVLGALCLIDFKPRRFADKDRGLLKELSFVLEQSIRAREMGAARSALVETLSVARRESLIDPMLRTWNRGGIAAILDQQRAQPVGKEGKPFSVLMVDVDRFKQVNDRYGHLVGDVVLRAVTRTLLSTLRSGDELGRFGGDEFLVMLPATSVAEAEPLSRRLTAEVSALRIPTTAGEVRCSISIGVAERANGGAESMEALIHRADLDMLSRKRSKPSHLESFAGRQTG